MSRPVLYDYWRSSASYRVRIALNLAGIDYDAVPIDLLKNGHKSAEHLKRNPQGLVPALEIDGQLLTQSLAIIEYLDETGTGLKFLPSDPLGRARSRAMAYVIAMEIHPICNTSVAAHVVELTGGGDETRVAWMQKFIRQGLVAFEALLTDRPAGGFCHGTDPGLADCCLIPQLYNADRWGADYSDCQNIRRIAASCAELNAFTAAHPDRIGPPPQ